MTRLARLYCMSVFINDFKDRTWLAAGSVKTLRVIEGIPAHFERPGARAISESSEPATLRQTGPGRDADQAGWILSGDRAGEHADPASASR